MSCRVARRLWQFHRHLQHRAELNPVQPRLARIDPTTPKGLLIIRGENRRVPQLVKRDHIKAILAATSFHSG